MISRRHYLTALCAALLLAGCSSAPTVTEPHRTYTGRLNAKMSADHRSESMSARYRLVDADRTVILDILSPLAGLLARVTVDATGAQLEKGGEVVARARTGQELMQQAFSIGLPVSVLRQWLRGEPSSAPQAQNWAMTVLKRHADGSPAALEIHTLEGIEPHLQLTLTIEP